MPNRNFEQFSYSLCKQRVVLHAHVAVGATGAPTLQAWNPNARTYSTAGSGGTEGIKSIARTGTGLYTITLQDSYQRVLDVNVMFSLAGGLSAIMDVGLNTTLTNVNSNSTPTVAIACMSSTATAADPDSGSTMDIEILLQGSTAL